MQTSVHRPTTSDTVPHVHDVSIDTALEFLDTLEYEHGEPVELLQTTAAAVDWLHEHRVLHEHLEPECTAIQTPGIAADLALARVWSVRAALRELVDATVEERPPAESALEIANAAMGARQRLVLVRRSDTPLEAGSADAGRPSPVILGHEHEGDPLDDAVARIAERIAREVSGDDADRLRICANETCRYVFFDDSRTGKRRWCDMATCGNRAKAARHRARARRSSPLDAPAERATPTS
jgi:predicted RNA-binding Zn ribbon-like protein